MNKFGFISSFLTTVLLFLRFIPLGIYFGSDTYPWLGFNSHLEIPIQLFKIEGQDIFLWGIFSNNSVNLWFNINYLAFTFLSCLALAAILLSFIGCLKESETGKKLIKANFYCLFVIVIFLLVGIPIYSKEILGGQLGYLDIFNYIDYGFYIILANLIVALVAIYTHPVISYEM
ncbi:MAG: hypothetical protein R6U96_13240 [Promethearchaeia archaeon]